jgi:hypothetical protein
MKKDLGRPKEEERELKTLQFSVLIKPSVGSVIDSMAGSRADVIERLLNEHLERLEYDSRG